MVKGDLPFAHELLARGADVNARNERGEAALLYVTHYNRGAIIRDLVAAGSEVNLPKEDGLTPLMLAAMQGKGTTGENSGLNSPAVRFIPEEQDFLGAARAAPSLGSTLRRAAWQLGPQVQDVWVAALIDAVSLDRSRQPLQLVEQVGIVRPHRARLPDPAAVLDRWG